MTKPTTRIYISFDTGWTGTSPTWVEVTSKVRHEPGLSITAGRSDELSETQPNTLSLTLRNDDGRFTPGNTASPYYPNVKKGRRIKVVSTLNGVDTVRFLGYINDWKPTWFATVAGVNDCSITATSRMGRLGKGAELRSVIEEETLLGAPASYYVLSEPEGSTLASDSSGNNVGPLRVAGLGAPVVFGSGTGPAGDGRTAVQFAGGKYLSRQTGGATTLSLFALSTADGQLVAGTGPSGSSITLSVTGSTLSAAVFATNGNSAGVSATFSAGVTHHIGLICTGTVSLYIDGVLVDTDTLLGSVPITAVDIGQGWSGTMSHLAFSASSAAFADIAEAGLVGFGGETPAARITRYASYVGIGPSELALDTGQVPDLAHIDTTGRTAIDAMRAVEDTEEGVLFDARDGTLTFHDRAHRYSSTTAFTLSMSAGQIANAPEPVLDDQHLLNDITATSIDGQVQAIVTDAASVDEHGWYRDPLDVASTNEDEPLLHATWLVNQYAEPLSRVSAVEVLLNTASPTLSAALLAATVGTRFTLTGLPANAPASSMSLFVEGAAETITNSEHRITFYTSPASVYDVFTLDDPVRGVLDSAYPLAF